LFAFPMADHLARIFGTEEDKVNCPFYYKIGACRHGERCSRMHMKPLFSQTIIIPHMYTIPIPDPTNLQPVDDSERFEDFYEEIMEELVKFGYVEQLHVVENLGEHMFGNVYVKFKTEEQAEAALKALTGRYYAGRILTPEYSPVTDFREARCRQFDETHCARGGYCNFMHLKHVPRHLRHQLVKLNRRWGNSRSRSRSKSRSREPVSGRRDKERARVGSRDRSRERRKDKDRRRSRSRSRSPAKSDAFDARSNSAERRARIAAMNQKRLEQQQPSAASAPPR